MSDQLEEAVRRFEDAWRQGEAPRVEDFLPADGPLRRKTLVELVHADLECRLKAGEPARVEAYLERFPELGNEDGVLLSLAAAEFDLRRRQEPGLAVAEYRRRFPQCQEELAARLESYSPLSPTQSLPADASPPGLLPAIPGFQVLSLLARGGMGAVYRARQERLDRLVAIKVMLPQMAGRADFASRFAREAQALARLGHSHIVTVHDFGQAGEFCYLVMELIEGDSLRQRLRAGKLSPAEAVRIALAVCDALAYAHEAGIVHRDIKPENILIDKKGQAKVADFGLAKLADSAGQTLTATHQVLGTWHYMAPEQLHQPGRVDQRADIYSLGVVLYEMLTGELPLGRFPPLAGPLDAVVGKMLAKEPDDRFASAAEVEFALEAVPLDQPAVAEPAADGLTARFALAAGGAFTAGWLLTGALANLGLAGLIVAAVVMTLLAGRISQAAIARVPELDQEWRTAGPALGMVNRLLGLTLFLLGYFALVAGHLVWWDRAAMNPGEIARFSGGNEQRLVEQLPSLAQAAPARLEIAGHEARLSQRSRLANWLGLTGVLLIPGAFLCLLETQRLRNRWAGHWQPVLVLSAAVLLALPVAHAANWLAGIPGRIDQEGVSLSTRRVQLDHRHVLVKASQAQTLERLTAWAQQHDYLLEMRATWTVQTVPDRQAIAQLTWIEGRPRSLFERWRFTLQGAQRTRPMLQIQCLSRANGAESLVQINPGTVREGAAEAADWTEILDQLEQSLVGTAKP